MPWKDREKYNAYKRKYYERNKQRERKRVRSNKSRQVSNGKCKDCWKKRAFYPFKLCLKCKLREAAGRHFNSRERAGDIQSIISKQKGRCYYTGVELKRRKVNLDHKLPRVRYPELKRDKDNLVLCIEEVNRAKGAMTDTEFINMCRLVVLVHGI